MGVVKTIDYDKWPKQSDWVGRRVRVCYNYDTTKTHEGEIVRDDLEDPGTQIMKLDNGRYILSTECQWQLKD